MSVVALVIAPSIAMNSKSVTSYVNSKTDIIYYQDLISKDKAIKEPHYLDEISKKKEKK